MAQLDREVQGLYELAQRRDQESREELYGAIADLFERREQELSQSERELMRGILGQLSDDIEMSIRIRLAERLADSAGAPHDLALMLANDTIKVARAVLERSPVLLDEDLIEIVQQRTQRHRLSITVRQELSPSVCAALVDAGDEGVMISLVKNPGAEIALRSMEKIVDISRHNERLQQPLLARTDLPPGLAKKMFTWVSSALQDYICQQFKVDREALETDLALIAEDLLAEHDERKSAHQLLIDGLLEAGDLTPRFAVKALREGNIELFELALATLSDLHPTRARRLIYDPKAHGLAVVCKATGFERATFLSIHRLVRSARGVTQQPSHQEMEQIDKFFTRIDEIMARTLIDEWSEESDFQTVDIDDPTQKA